jgi:hypothetical protein
MNGLPGADMRKRLFLLFVLAPAAAFAAAPPPNELGLTEGDCQAMAVTHKPAPDVAYKSGVDVHGKPVVEADLDPPDIELPEIYQFPLTVDAAKYMGMAVPPELEGKTTLGMVTVSQNGDATFNGKPLEGSAQAALKAACAELEKSEEAKP